MDPETQPVSEGLMPQVMARIQALHDNLHKQGYAGPAPENLSEANKRNSAADYQCMHESHGHAMALGAVCQEAMKPALDADGDAPGDELTEPAQPMKESVGAPARPRLHEAAAPTGYDALKREVVLTVLAPGFNATHSRFYTREACASVVTGMKGRKQYVNHALPAEQRDRPERDVRDWVSTITETWQDPDGTVKARATLIDPAFQERVARLAEAGLLDQLGASISAVGIGDEQIKEGRKTFVVDGIEQDDPFRSVDWVTEPGAGGRAELLESRKETTVDNAELVQKLQETTESLAKVTQVVESIRRGQLLDSLLITMPVSEAAKAAVKAELLGSNAEVTAKSVREAVQARIAEAAQILGHETGVRGFGPEADEENTQTAEAELRTIFESYGLKGEALEVAITGR